MLKEVVMLLRGQSKLVMGSNTWVGVLAARMVALDVATGAIR